MFASYAAQEIEMKESALRQQKESERMKKKRLSQPISKSQLRSADHDKWELNRMYIGGAVNSSIQGLREDVVDDDMEEERIIL